MELPAYFTALLSFAFCVLFWLSIMALLSELSGWQMLSRQFPDCGSISEGKKFSSVSGSIKRLAWFPVKYKGCLSVKIGSDGFSLTMFLLMRFRSPSLFILFDELESVEIISGGFRGSIAVVTFKSSKISIQIYGAAGAAIEKAFKNFRGQTS